MSARFAQLLFMKVTKVMRFKVNETMGLFAILKSINPENCVTNGNFVINKGD